MNNKIKKRVMLLVFMLALGTGCGKEKVSTSMTYNYEVETGDEIKIELDTSDNYSISPDIPFVISCDDQTLTQGTFITKETYLDYKDSIDLADSVTLLDSGETDDIEYIYWTNNESEYDYAIYVKNSDTGIILGNNISRDSAEECFGRLQISKN